MESLTKEYASPVCVCMQLRKAGRVVTQIYDRCLRPVGIRGTQFALLKRIACMRRPFITDIGKVLGRPSWRKPFPCGKRRNGKSGNTSATTGWGICAPCFRF